MSYPGPESSSTTPADDRAAAQPATPAYPPASPGVPAPASTGAEPQPSTSFGSAPPYPPAPTFTPAATYQPPAQPTYDAPSNQPPVATPVPVPAPPAEATAQAPAFTPGYQPVPSAPTYDPSMMAQQYSAPPVSAPYGYQPVPSAMPAPPVKRGRAGVVVLAVTSTLLLLSTGVMTTLFIQQKQDADKSAAQVVQLTSQVGTQTTKIDTLQKDLDTAQRDLTDAKAATDEANSQKKVIADCVNAIYAYFKALNASQGRVTSAVSAAEKTLNTKCDAADKYLSISRH